MSQVSKLLSDELISKAEAGLKKLGKYGLIAGRLQIIVSAKKHGITEVCRIYGISRTTFFYWIKRLEREGAEGLANGPKKARSPLAAHTETIKKWAKKDPNAGARELVAAIEEKLGVKTSVAAVYRLLKKLNPSYITPRPRHYKQREGGSEGFKKNLAEKFKGNEKRPIFFLDESRFGTHSKIGRGWYPRGSRTPAEVKLGYKNFYLYGAANPLTGEAFNLILPNVDTDCMNVFLKEFALELGGAEILLVLDGAGWHKSKRLETPDNMTLFFLPPYSPELNPVERLWQYIKKHTIKNRLYETIGALEDGLCNFLKTIDPQTVAGICKLDYLFNYI